MNAFAMSTHAAGRVPSPLLCSNGVSIRPVALSSSAAATATANETTNPISVSRSTCPRSFPKSISNPARKRRNARPITEITEIDWSTWTIPSTDGPMTIPATISRTTDGSRSPGKNPRTNGAANATATTIRRPPKEGICE